MAAEQNPTLRGYMKPLEAHYFDCSCTLAEHTLRFVYDPDYGDLYTEVFLNQFHPWHKRLWYAIKYTLGLSSGGVGHFDCWMLNSDHCDRLIDLLQQAKAKQKETEACEPTT